MKTGRRPNREITKIYLFNVTRTACILQLATCLINAQAFLAHHHAADDNEISSCQVVIWMRSFIKPDLFDNNVHSTIPLQCMKTVKPD